MTRGRVLIKACLNGARAPGSHPALPVTPQQLAAAAKAAAEAGAGAVHIHVRDASGRESLDPENIAASLRAIREAAFGLPAGVSTGAWIVPDVSQRYGLVSSWRELPDFASVNWSEDGAEELAALLIDRGVGVEAGLFTLEHALAFAMSPLASECLRALIEVRERDGESAVQQAAAMDSAIVDLGVPLLHHGFGAGTWEVLDVALRLGRDVRIGLEDTFTLPDGTTATDNAELVAAACDMARRLGLEPSRP
jgi:uncharacterized protein (DUF849 family)